LSVLLVRKRAGAINYRHSKISRRYGPYGCIPRRRGARVRWIAWGRNVIQWFNRSKVTGSRSIWAHNTTGLPRIMEMCGRLLQGVDKRKNVASLVRPTTNETLAKSRTGSGEKKFLMMHMKPFTMDRQSHTSITLDLLEFLPYPPPTNRAVLRPSLLTTRKPVSRSAARQPQR
jgi:hypothetical protein